MKQTAGSIPICGAEDNKYLGLIQFGPQEQAKYGVKPGMLLGYRGHLDGLYRHHQPEQFRRCPRHLRCRHGAEQRPDDRGDAEQHQRPLRKLAWECVASFAIVSVLIMGPASSVGVTSFLICLRRAFAIGSLALRRSRR